jgi:DNA-binding CsgD family transcriptional regulator
MGSSCSGAARDDEAPSSSPQAVVAALLAHRGDATALGRVFESTQMPMALVDSHRHYLDANPAAQLFLRRTRRQLRRMRTDDLVPPDLITQHERQWDQLTRDGSLATSIWMRTPDNRLVEIEYAAVTNVLPGVHLCVWMPINWPHEDFAKVQAPAPRARLTNRERQVLTELAKGGTLDHIAGELSLSTTTVRTHVRNALVRLGAQNRAHAVALALRDGEISFE